MEAKKTPLHPCHVSLRARMVPFAGFEMPVQYSGVLDEVKAVRKSCGLFDVSHMGQLVVRGPRALAEVDKLVTNDLGTLAVGQAQYNILCNPGGGTIDDLIVYRRSEKEVFICVNAANRSSDVDWFLQHLSAEVSFEDVSDRTALIAIQGPQSEALLSRFADPGVVGEMKYYWAESSPVMGRPCYISRTGYTGEDGFELYLDNAHATEVWETLLEEGRPSGLQPIGLGARDTLRLEMGYPLHGHELSPTLSPLSAGLSWVVKLNKKTPFMGQEALKKEKEAGPQKVLKAFTLEDRRIPRAGYPILTENSTPVGTITSGTFSPHRNCPIALGFVDKSVAAETSFRVAVRDSHLTAQTTRLPFVESKTKRSR